MKITRFFAAFVMAVFFAVVTFAFDSSPPQSAAVDTKNAVSVFNAPAIDLTAMVSVRSEYVAEKGYIELEADRNIQQTEAVITYENKLAFSDVLYPIRS